MVRTSKLVTILAALGLLSVACSKDDNPAPKLSQQGESCRSSGDCAGSLLCITQQCSAGDVAVNPESKQCSLVACTTQADCCTPTYSAQQCSDYNTACAADATSIDCTYYNAGCCPQSAIDRYTCTNGQCVSTCTVDADCPIGTARTHCSGSTCVQCADDSHCGANQTCATDTHTCSTKCTTDGQCPALQHCQSDHCVVVGCANDRECVAYTLTPTSTCDMTTHRCSAKCTNDAECLDHGIVQTGLNYAYQVCVNGSCQSAGCQSDDECKDLLKASITTTRTAVCAAPVTN